MSSLDKEYLVSLYDSDANGLKSYVIPMSIALHLAEEETVLFKLHTEDEVICISHDYTDPTTFWYLERTENNIC